MKQFTPRHLRKKYRNKNGDSGVDKKRAFRRVAQWSKLFIKQPASELCKEPLASEYRKWCARSANGGLR